MGGTRTDGPVEFEPLKFDCTRRLIECAISFICFCSVLGRWCFSHYIQTLYSQMDSSFWFDTINLGWLIVYKERSHVIFEPWHVISNNVAF